MIHYQGNKIYVTEYDMLRVMTILLVVLGHSDFLSSHYFDITNTISDTLAEYSAVQEPLNPL